MNIKESDIIAAKEYLQRRIDAEHSMVYNLEIVMRQAAEKIVKILYSANIPIGTIEFGSLPNKVQVEINGVIDWLRITIDDYFQTLAFYEKEKNKDIILAFVMKKNHGLTFYQRLTDYCEKYRTELLILIGAGLVLGVNRSTLIKSIENNLKRPFDNPTLKEGISTPPTYGVGRTNSMFTALSGLTTFGIAQAWMRDWEITTEKAGAVGWDVRRGSSYPCEMCDDNCGFHSIDEGTDLPQHNSCCCFAVPIYNAE